jgi:hypothetical protein
MPENEEFWEMVGTGILLFLLCLGIGTCSVMQNADVKINVNQNVELK